MKVAVVRNRKNTGIVNWLGQPCPEVVGRRTVQRVIDALRVCGHTVAFFEGDKRLVAKLEKFVSRDAETTRPDGIVFNMAFGIQGECRYTHVPGMLEMAGIPYTGSGPLGHALALDKVIAKVLMRNAGVPTPSFQVMSRPDQRVDGLEFPLIVKPRHESTSYGLHLVRNSKELENAVLEVLTQYQQEAIAEEYVDGREIYVALLGNDTDIECLPFVELDFGVRELRTLTWDDKYHKSPDEPGKVCPAPVSEELAAKLRDLSLATFRACCCRDYARVDIRVDVSGNPFVLEINSMASLGPGGNFVLAAQEAGYSFEKLVSRILDVTYQRYFGAPAPAGPCVAERGAEDFSQGEFSTISPDRDGQDSFGPDVAAEGPAPIVVSLATGPGAPSQEQLQKNNINPFQLTKFYDDQIHGNGYFDQLKYIVEPSLEEFAGSGQADTSGEHDSTRVTGLQHKYPQTALVLVTNQCFSHCRFCFRKRLVGKSSEEIVRDYGAVAEYIKAHPEINNVLISGGDPFVLGTQQLHSILDHLLAIPHLTSIRFGTRAIVYYPPRFLDEDLGGLFKRILTTGKTPVIVTHVNHIGEVSEESGTRIRELRKVGVQFFNQAVLLNKINDEPDILAATFEKLHSLGVRPYYLFQARPVKGALHFQVPLRRGVAIVHAVNRRLSGIQKTFRYIMAHYTGKIEILDIADDNRLYMRYHQSRDPQKVGMIFSLPCPDSARWLDDLSAFSDTLSVLEPC